MAAATKYAERSIPRISLANHANRIDEITTQLVHAAETHGFFSLTNTEISIDEIEAIFRTSESFFNLPDDVKATVPFTHKNVGWEKSPRSVRRQVSIANSAPASFLTRSVSEMVRVRTGTDCSPNEGFPDQKESYQLQFGANMADKWISPTHLPSFQTDARAFMHKAQSLSEKLMLCFARGLPRHLPPGLPELDRSAGPLPETFCRAGAHADWDLLTLLFQRPGQSGLEICPGREAVTNFGIGDTWTRIEFAPGDIVCNIGDLLMSWSDDRFKSTFHRVKAPSEDGDYFGPRYSIAFFNQPCTDCEVQGPKGKYPKVTGAEFTKAAMERNFTALQAKKEEMSREACAAGTSAQVGVIS
ncbi:hypothetical protein D0865_02163 [Hortaea werneckii]|uniref:Fe2OG dioxygenase domain-containing protein n=1 Tax=Hortaea werneckii TaxID=91943 RepID=A0A3M7D4P2_HORWE|nr:hypothetical protein D0865_02163 [Hortaea werneckii]